MKDEWYKPIYIKTILGFLLIMVGLLLTFLVYRFFPVPKSEGFDGLGAVMLTLYGLGGTEVLYILGVVFSRNHPYVVFCLSLFLFIFVLIFIRSFGV